MSHRVLVVDDDADIREAMVEVLEESGHAATGVANGNEALVHLRANPVQPCLIVREEQLRDPALSPIPVIVVSAFRDVAQTAELMQVAAHLKKPVSSHDLVQLVERYCLRTS